MVFFVPEHVGQEVILYYVKDRPNSDVQTGRNIRLHVFFVFSWLSISKH